MSFQCLHCHEAWAFEDYCCPICDRHTIDAESSMKPTLEYRFYGANGQRVNPHKTNPQFDHAGQKVNFTYDVIRISTGKSVFDESEAA